MFIKTLLLVGAVSLAAASAAYATDGPGSPTDGTGRSHASAAPACGYECPVLAGDGGPGGPTDGTSRSGARVATDGPGGPTDGTGRSSAALSQGGAEFLVASIRAGQGDF
jgi:hypothetical protein